MLLQRYCNAAPGPPRPSMRSGPMATSQIRNYVLDRDMNSCTMCLFRGFQCRSSRRTVDAWCSTVMYTSPRLILPRFDSRWVHGRCEHQRSSCRGEPQDGDAVGRDIGHDDRTVRFPAADVNVPSRQLLTPINHRHNTRLCVRVYGSYTTRRLFSRGGCCRRCEERCHLFQICGVLFLKMHMFTVHLHRSAFGFTSST